MVGRPFPEVRWGCKALPEGLKGLGGPPRSLGEIGTSSWRSGWGWDFISAIRETLAVVREGSKHPPRGQGGVGRPCRRSERGQNVLPQVREGF